MFDGWVGSGADGFQRMDFEPLKVKDQTGLTLLSAGAFLMVLGYAIMALAILWMLPRLNDPDIIEVLVNAEVSPVGDRKQPVDFASRASPIRGVCRIIPLHLLWFFLRKGVGQIVGVPC